MPALILENAPAARKRPGAGHKEQALVSESSLSAIALYRRGVVIAHSPVDPQDYAWAAQYRWHISSYGYACRFEPRERGRPYRQVLMHREILGLELGDPREGDHINRDKLDNRRGNLRIVPRGSNQQNISPAGFVGSSSRFRGVRWRPSKRKWMASGFTNQRWHYLGYFESEEEAAEVVAAWRREHMPYAVEEDA